ncbi:inositol monophosphatase [Ectothiorhodospiraceae bacterium BW-2]|nr:inositol monophosphatase [Ectothiorhodospiraceae bacterium BW-2]
MHPMLNIAVNAALKAGNYISRSLEQVDRLQINNKSRHDYVTEVDERAEQMIIETLTKAYPDHGFWGEESGQNLRDSDYVWIIDPLDGTTNFIHGVPQFAVSIALQHKGQLTQAVVYDPVSQELFTASKGGGAQLNNRRLRVTQRRSMKGALLGTGFPFRPNQNLELYLQTLKALIPDSAGIRRPGSAALDLAWVAAGRFDGFWEFGLNPWDIAAGVLLIKEAGGLVGDMRGDEGYMQRGDLVAAGPKLFGVMIKRLQPVLAATQSPVAADDSAANEN